MIQRDTQLRVRYEETDKMGVVYHSNYIIYYQVGRTEMFREIGLSYDALEKMGFIMPVVEVSSRYKSPAYYDELLTVRTIIREMPMARLAIDYEIYNEQGTLLNTGRTVLGFVDAARQRPCRAPQPLIDILRKAGVDE